MQRDAPQARGREARQARGPTASGLTMPFALLNELLAARPSTTCNVDGETDVPTACPCTPGKRQNSHSHSCHAPKASHAAARRDQSRSHGRRHGHRGGRTKPRASHERFAQAQWPQMPS